MTPPNPSNLDALAPGDLFQINEHHGRAGWVGCIVMSKEIHPWGIIAFVSWPDEHDKQTRAFIRLDWIDVEYVGRAFLIPKAEDPAPGHPDLF